MKFNTIKEALEYLQCEGYDPDDLQNDCGYIPQTWEEVAEQIRHRELHTYIGEWVYFELVKMKTTLCTRCEKEITVEKNKVEKKERKKKLFDEISFAMNEIGITL